MATHRIYHDSPDPLIPGRLAVVGEEAHHAVRVKRLEIGDPVEILDGRGTVGAARIEAIEKTGGEWRLTLAVGEVRRCEPARPRLEVLTAAPKGSRLEEMIDGLSQVGAASWSLLETTRGEVDPRPGKLERMRRVAAEASKQCGRPWLLEIGSAEPFARAVAARGVVVADASGEPYRASSAETIRLLVGPEGGWTPAELELARRSGAKIARFGGHTMRVETAAVAASAIILAMEAGLG